VDSSGLDVVRTIVMMGFKWSGSDAQGRRKTMVIARFGGVDYMIDTF